jgi:hypothetical protein
MRWRAIGALNDSGYSEESGAGDPEVTLSDRTLGRLGHALRNEYTTA